MTADPTLKKRPDGDKEQPLKDQPLPPAEDFEDDEDEPEDLMFDDTMDDAPGPGDDKQQDKPADKPDFAPVGESVTNHNLARDYRDGLSDKITADATHALSLPPDHPIRQQLVKDLVDRFDNPSTYAEKLAAARSLLSLTRGPDGKVPDVLTQRDVLIPEKVKYESGGRNQPMKRVVEVAQHHEMKPVAAREILDFLERSAPEIESRTKALLKTPNNAEDRASYVKHLVNVFQTSGAESPEKLAAAEGLVALCSGQDGKMPDLIGTRAVYHPKKTHQEGGGRGGMRTVTDKEAYTEKIDTTAQQVRDYLSTRADGYLRRTEEALKNPANEAAKKTLIDHAVKTFFDATNPEDKAAAASALLALNRKPDGTYNEVLGARVVHLEKLTRTIPATGGRYGKPATTEVIRPASDRTDTVKLDDAVQYLKARAGDVYAGSGRLVAADGLVRAGKMTEEQRKSVYEQSLLDARTPEHVKAHVRQLLGLDKQDAERQKERDGRVEKPDVPHKTLQLTDDEQRKLATTIERLLPAVTATGGEGKALILPETIEAMRKELAEKKFGEASRTVYNRCAEFLNEATTDMAIGLSSRGMALPPGCPIRVPRDISGRAQDDALFTEEVKAGRLKMDLKPLANDQAPSAADVERVKNTGEWVTKAARQADSARLHWQVHVFDQNIEQFNSKDDKLKAWKSKEGMTDTQLEQLQASRAEWLGTALQVRNYAHTIANYNLASKQSRDAHRILWDSMPTSIVSGTDSAVFPDEGLQDGKFPGKVIRENGKITSIELDLPTTLDRDNPENLAKMEKIRQWMEKYGAKVDQATAEIAKANSQPERMLFWGDMPAEGKTADGKPYNKMSFRYSADTVQAKNENGVNQTMIKVVMARQTEYSPDYSYLGWADYEVGKGQYSGKATINGQPIEPVDKEMTVGKTGAIKISGPEVEDSHALVKTDNNGQIYLKDTSTGGIYVNGKRMGSEWTRINPVSDKITFGPEPTVDLKMKDGVLTLNGQKVEKSVEGVAVGKNGPIKFEGTTAENNHALIKYDQGKVFIKDTSTSGTYVNGERISKENWTEIDPTKDQLSLGQPTKMETDSDVRLYKPDDWVTIMLDGKMQVLQAKDLNLWANEAKTWHYGGKAATVAMDVGMIVSGTIELKAAYMAAAKVAATVTAKELAKVAAKEVLPHLLRTEGFKRGAFHLALGVTGFTHQFMENQGEAGKTFNKMRGYVMMADISWNNLAKPAGAWFGLTKGAAKEGSTLAEYLKTAPKLATVKKYTDGVFMASNFYFIPEIVSHQFPTIEKELRGWNSEALLLQGRRQRGGEYVNNDTPPPATEEGALRFASPELKKRAAAAAEEAKAAAKLEDGNPKKEELRRKYAAEFLGPEPAHKYDVPKKDKEAQLVAAVGLLNLSRRADGSYPDSLGDRYCKNGLPEEVKHAYVKHFLSTMELDSVNAFDKQAKARIEDAQKVVSQVKDKPDNDAARQKAIAGFAESFLDGKSTDDKLAGALALLSLSEKDGALPDVVARVPDGKGGTREVRKEQVEAFLKGLNNQFSIDQFERYANWMDPNKTSAQISKTKECLKLPADNKDRKSQIDALSRTLLSKDSSNESKTEAAICLLMLARNTENGSLPKQISFQTSAQIFSELKKFLPSAPAGMRLAAGDLLYRAGQKSLHGQTPSSDLGGVLLSVLKDPKASNELKMQAILNSNGIGLAEIMEKHRFADEPSIARLKGEERLRAQADLSGRDSFAIQEALRATASQPIDTKLSPKEQAQQRDLKALALATLMANSEKDQERRFKALESLHSQAKQNPEAGAYARAYFEKLRDELPAKTHDAEERLRRFNAALVLKTSGQAAEYGVTEKQLVDVFADCVRPNEPELARQAMDQVLPHFNGPLLSDEKRERILEHISYAIKSKNIDPTTNADLLKREWIDRITELAEKTDPKKVLEGFKDDLGDPHPGAREIFTKMLTPGTQEFNGATAESRAAAARALSKVGSNDLATRALLKKALGLEGGPADPSALVRTEAFETLVQMKPPGMRDMCLELLTKETDSELLRRIKGMEKGERRLDPSSQEYKERFRVALRDLLTSSKRSLVGSEEYIRKEFPLLDGINLRKEEISGHIDKYYKDFGGFLNWTFSSQSTIDQHKKSEIERVGKAMNDQFDDLIARARGNNTEADQARRALAWIVMSNAKSFSMSEKEAAVKRAAEGLLNVAKDGTPEAKQGMAPLITMSLTTQDRMPFSARVNVLDALEALKPGTPGSPISARDAGIAALGALRRQFHNTPAADGSKYYQDSHELQRRLLETCEKYMTPEGIPILEAIAEERTKSQITRDALERITNIKYPDKSSRSVDYDADGKIWKDTFTSADGKTTVLVREGKSDLWYLSTDTEKKNPWRGQPYFDHASGNYVRKDSYGTETITTPAGARAERKDGIVSKVHRADGTIYEVLRYGNQPYQTIRTDAAGIKNIWKREGNTDTWYKDTDTAKKSPWKGKVDFDPQTLDYVYTDDKNKSIVMKADGGMRELREGKPHYSGPGVDDLSAHNMPVIRDKARDILSRLRDDTGVLRDQANLDGQANPQALAAKLQSVLDAKESNSEDVIKAIFATSMSKQLSADDPRRPILQGLLNDPHERIQLAAARMLFSSPVKEDRERAAEVIADLQKNASRVGYRKDAQKLFDEVKAQPEKFNPGDDQILKNALDRTKAHAQPREEVAPTRILKDRPIDHQEAYEIAKAEMLRDSQRSLAKFHGKDWWKANGYELLDERNVPEARVAAIKSVEPGFFRFWTSFESTLKKERDDALAQVNDRLVGQFEKLLSAADKDAKNGGVEAREALSYIVLSQGEPFGPRDRDAAMKIAAGKLADIYRNAGENADDVGWTIKAALVANPNIPRGVRDQLAAAVVLRHQDERAGRKPKGKMTDADVSALLVATLESEYMAMPQPNQAGYKDSVELQKAILGLVKSYKDRVSMPVIEALAQGHPDAGMKKDAQAYFEEMRDSVRWAARGVKPDITTSNEKKAEQLSETLKNKNVDDEFAVREIFRLAYPTSMSDDPAVFAKDPRRAVLYEAIKHPNERVRVAAAQVIATREVSIDAMTTVAEAVEYTQRPGLKKESSDFLAGGIEKINKETTIAIAEAILKHKGESKELLGILQDPLKARELPITYDAGEGRQVVVRRMRLGETIIEEFRNGKLEKSVVPPGKNYAQVLLEDAGNYKLSAEKRAVAARDALMNESYGKLSTDERNRAIRILGNIVEDGKTNETVRLQYAKFLGSEASLKEDEAKAARIKAFDAIVDLAAHGKDTKAESKKIITADASAEVQAMRSLNRALSNLKSGADGAKERVAQNLQLQGELLKSGNLEREALFYSSIMAGEKVVGGDDAAIVAAAALVDRTSKDHKMTPLTGKDDLRIPPLLMALQSGNSTMSASAALAFLDSSLKPGTIEQEFKNAARGAMLRHTEELFRKASDIDDKNDAKASLAAWSAVEDTLNRIGEDPKNFNLIYATMKRMSLELGPTHKDLAPLYEKLAAHYEKTNETAANEFRKKANECQGIKAAEAAKPSTTQPPATLPADFEKTMEDALAVSQDAIASGDTDKMKSVKKDLLDLAGALRNTEGASSLRLATVLSQVGTIGLNTDDVKQGEAALKEAAAIFEKSGAEKLPPAAVDSLLGLTKLYAGNGDTAAFKEYQGKMMNLSKMHGYKTIEVRTTEAFTELADICALQAAEKDMMKDAEKLLLEAERLTKERTGPISPESALATRNLADFYSKPGNPRADSNKAANLLKESLNAMELTNPMRGEEWAVTKAKLANSARLKGDYKTAVGEYQQALNVMRQSPGVNPMKLREVESAYADALLGYRAMYPNEQGPNGNPGPGNGPGNGPGFGPNPGFGPGPGPGDFPR